MIRSFFQLMQLVETTKQLYKNDELYGVQGMGVEMETLLASATPIQAAASDAIIQLGLDDEDVLALAEFIEADDGRLDTSLQTPRHILLETVALLARTDPAIRNLEQSRKRLASMYHK